MGVITAWIEVDTILIALGITCGVVLLLTLFAFQTKIDFTKYYGYLAAGLFVLIMFGMMSMRATCGRAV